MKRILMTAIILATMLVSTPRQAAADMTETLAYTFAVTLAGTVVGAYALPYVVPVVAPTVATAYTATTGAVNSVLTGTGSILVLEPRLFGAIAGMAAGLGGGLYYFSEAPQDPKVASKETSNTVVRVRQ